MQEISLCVGSEGNAIGVDPSEFQINSAREKCNHLNNVEFLRCNADSIRIDSGSCDAVTFTQTLEYIDYISRLLDYVDIMDKKFYVVVPFETFTSKKISIFTRFLERFRQGDTRSSFLSRLKQFDKLKTGLESRTETVIHSLANCGLEVKRLNTRELIEYFYEAYNPEISRNESLTDENLQNLS